MDVDKLDGSAREVPSTAAMPQLRRRLTEREIEAALRACCGIQSAAAQALEKATGLHVSRQSINERIKRSSRLQQTIVESREEILDLAEGVLLHALHNKDVNVAKFMLETRGKDRGYSRRDAVALTVDPRTLSDEELLRATAQVKAMLREIEESPAPPALPAPVKRPRG
jgi:hypothetical protein